MFKKKFKVRLKHFCSGKYAIEYCHYYLIPIWDYIGEWDYILGWHKKLVSADYVNEFNSMEDVNAFHRAGNEKRRLYLAEQNKLRIVHSKYDGKILKE